MHGLCTLFNPFQCGIYTISRVLWSRVSHFRGFQFFIKGSKRDPTIELCTGYGNSKTMLIGIKLPQTDNNNNIEDLDTLKGGSVTRFSTIFGLKKLHLGLCKYIH